MFSSFDLCCFCYEHILDKTCQFLVLGNFIRTLLSEHVALGLKLIGLALVPFSLGLPHEKQQVI
jgi:hypothetical protein